MAEVRLNDFPRPFVRGARDLEGFRGFQDVYGIVGVEGSKGSYCHPLGEPAVHEDFAAHLRVRTGARHSSVESDLQNVCRKDGKRTPGAKKELVSRRACRAGRAGGRDHPGVGIGAIDIEEDGVDGFRGNLRLGVHAHRIYRGGPVP